MDTGSIADSWEKTLRTRAFRTPGSLMLALLVVMPGTGIAGAVAKIDPGGTFSGNPQKGI